VGAGGDMAHVPSGTHLDMGHMAECVRTHAGAVGVCKRGRGTEDRRGGGEKRGHVSRLPTSRGGRRQGMWRETVGDIQGDTLEGPLHWEGVAV
jgi:hypothetical protein